MSRYEDLIGPEDALLATTGRAWVIGDHVHRTQLLSDEHLARSPSLASAFLLAAVAPQFARTVTAGDFLVGGLEFGIDAPHRTIALALLHLGIRAAIARSFGPAFARTALGVGLPALVVEETGAIKTGDRLRVDIEAHVVANLSSGDRYVIRNIDDETLAALRAGGLAEYTRQHKA